jgi:acyl-CoA reductase-like NAD-dependent aldehyde dehydrogenase
MSAYVTVYKRDDAEGAPYVHVAVYGIERGRQRAVAALVAAFDRWRRESSHQRSTRLYFIP